MRVRVRDRVVRVVRVKFRTRIRVRPALVMLERNGHYSPVPYCVELVTYNKQYTIYNTGILLCVGAWASSQKKIQVPTDPCLLCVDQIVLILPPPLTPSLPPFPLLL